MALISNLQHRTLAVVVVTTLFASQGCVSWRSIHPTSKSAAAGRQLARQGISAMECGQCTEGESILRAAIDKNPEDPLPRSHLAEALCRRNAKEEALEQFTAAAQLAPEDASLAVRTGELLLESNRAEEAASEAARAVRLDRDLADGWALRGRAQAAMGFEDRALADYQHALLLAPSNAEVLLALSSLYSRRGQHQRCLATLHRLLDTFPPGAEPADALLLEGSTYLALDRPAQAGERLALASERGLATAELRVMQAKVELARDRPQPAEQFVRQALTLDATHEPARQLLQQISQRPDSAEPYLR
ncbi:MAG: tetratricopeptide repeat protein [Aeoliella sp.]